MELLPIEQDATLNEHFTESNDCAGILEIYPDYYGRVGFDKPWIGYFAKVEGLGIIGAGGFKGKPQEGQVEIAYNTFQNFESKGLGTEICRNLVLISLQTDPTIKITARTLMEINGSTKILERNGFKLNGIVHDKEDGDVWEWIYTAIQ